jgi:hypothetical protein
MQEKKVVFEMRRKEKAESRRRRGRKVLINCSFQLTVAVLGLLVLAVARIQVVVFALSITRILVPASWIKKDATG